MSFTNLFPWLKGKNFTMEYELHKITTKSNYKAVKTFLTKEAAQRVADKKSPVLQPQVIKIGNAWGVKALTPKIVKETKKVETKKVKKVERKPVEIPVLDKEERKDLKKFSQDVLKELRK